MYTKLKGLLRVLLTAHEGEVSTKPMQGRRQTELMKIRHNNKGVWAHIYVVQRETALQSKAKIRLQKMGTSSLEEIG